MSRRKSRNKAQTKPSEELSIESFSHDGRGIARVDGKTVFVSNALPGEKVLARYTLVKSKFDEAETEEVIQASPDRVEPRCAHFGVCGGCSLQHYDANAQIQSKQESLLELLRSVGKTEPGEILPPLTADNWGYRRKARLGVRYVQKKGRVLVGFREKNSRYLADISQCVVLDARIGERLIQLGECIKSMQARETIPQVEVAAGDDEVALVVRHLEPLIQSDIEKLIQFGRDYNFKLWLQPKGPDTAHRIGIDSEEDNKKPLRYRLSEFDIDVAFLPTDFTQVNASLNQKMVSLALSFLDVQQDEEVLDLFCGLGNFSLPLATKAKHVVAVEGDKGLVERARANAERNGIDNIEYHIANLFEEFQQLPWARKQYDKILIDPPRSGAWEVASNLKRLNPQRLVYISCDPATLARDVEEIVHRQGYRLVRAGVMDMFPGTTHVESIAVFEP